MDPPSLPATFMPPWVESARAVSVVVSIILFGVVLSSCTAASRPGAMRGEPRAQARNQAVGSCGLEFSDSATDEDAIRAVLIAEGENVVKQDIDALMLLWLDGGSVVDAKNTPADADDDQSWRDKDAIRHRYVRTVFPGAPDVASPINLEIQIDGDSALVLGTTHIGDEMSPAGDRWRLVKVGGCWLIDSLTYNLEPVRP